MTLSRDPLTSAIAQALYSQTIHTKEELYVRLINDQAEETINPNKPLMYPYYVLRND